MTEARYEAAVGDLMEAFGDRLARTRSTGEVSVAPASAEEVRLLARIASRHSVPLVPLGAGTGDAPPREGVGVSFDLMSGVRLPEGDEPWVEAGPGASWLKLDNELLCARGRGLAVYPTSAPRATVGGWIATDGIGVGSFEYGRLWENVLSADVATFGGGLRKVGGEELGGLFGPGQPAGIVVGARLRTRRATADRPFAAAFTEPGGVAGAAAELAASSAPLWHLAFVSPTMAAARGLRASYLLFGLYPSQRDGEAWWALRRRVLYDHGGEELDVREAWRVWGERFFPVAPAHPTPHAARRFVAIEELPRKLEGSRPKAALQGTVARSGEVLLVTMGDDEGGSTRDIAEAEGYGT